MAESKVSEQESRRSLKWMALFVVVSLAVGIVLGYFLGPRADASEINQRVSDLEQGLALMENKTSLIETSMTGGEPLEQLSCAMYLNISGIPGGCQEAGHIGWIDMVSYSYESSKASDVDAPAYSDFSIQKYVDKSSPKLAEAMNSGEHIFEVVIEVVSADGSQMTYVLEDVIITSITVHSPPVGGSLTHIEEVGFTYSKIGWTYSTPGTSDTDSETVTSGWDVVENRPA